MSQWDDHAIEEKIVAILRGVHDPKPDALGQPFMSVYQIAIAFAERYPETFAALGYKLGGRGTGTRYALTNYLSQQLCDRISDQRITDIEAIRLSTNGVRRIEYDSKEGPIEASLEWDQAFFRLRG